MKPVVDNRNTIKARPLEMAMVAYVNRFCDRDGKRYLPPAPADLYLRCREIIAAYLLGLSNETNDSEGIVSE